MITAYRSSMSVALAALLAGSAGIGAAWAAGPAEADEHLIVPPADVEWSPGPGSLPEGAEFVVLEGDPAEPGPVTFRIRMPADYEIPPHTHPRIERVTVLSGTFNLGMGETLDRDDTTELPAGGFFALPPDEPHFAWVADDQTVIQLNVEGPWEITYLDPEDDPRRES